MQMDFILRFLRIAPSCNTFSPSQGAASSDAARCFWAAATLRWRQEEFLAGAAFTWTHLSPFEDFKCILVPLLVLSFGVMKNGIPLPFAV